MIDRSPGGLMRQVWGFTLNVLSSGEGGVSSSNDQWNAASVVCLQMNIIAGGFYDGLMLYSHALNETMSQSEGRPPGRVVTKRMWNRTFHGQWLSALLSLCSSENISRLLLLRRSELLSGTRAQQHRLSSGSVSDGSCWRWDLKRKAVEEPAELLWGQWGLEWPVLIPGQISVLHCPAR